MSIEGLSRDEIEDLKRAVQLLERESLPVRLATALGQPISRLIGVLPLSAGAGILSAANIALDRAVKVALLTLENDRRAPSTLLHKLMVTASGMVGGSFGLSGLAIELPITTVLMLRAIADIARAEGEDLTTPEAALACIEVFALGAGTDDDTADTGYFAIRSALATAVADAAAYLALTGAAGAGAAPVGRFLGKVGAKFGTAVTQKTAAQIVPVVGAVGAAAVNLAFMNYFQSVAQGHFIVRRLERAHGEAWIRSAYETIRDELRAADGDREPTARAA